MIHPLDYPFIGNGFVDIFRVKDVFRWNKLTFKGKVVRVIHNGICYTIPFKCMSSTTYQNN